MSATKMREHAKSKNFGEFRKGVPSHVSDTHAKELMHDTRKGMGLHESLDRGMFKAVFVTGGPGSGKDIIIRESISESRIVELNFIQAQEYLADKQKLSEKSNDYRQEAIRNRGPLIINGPADDTTRISYIKEELEELGYDTLMVFVNTTNETSRERNSLLARMMVESIRQEKWLKSQKNTKYFKETFDKFVSFDNTGDIDSKEQDIHEIYENVNNFLDTKTLNETAEDWLIRNSNLNINSLYKEQKNVKSPNRFLKNKIKGCGQHRFLADNNCPSCQLQRKSGRIDSVKDGDVQSNSSYTFRTYEESQPKVEVQPQAKEPNFQKDKEQINKKKRWVNSASGAIRSQGVGPEFDTRQQGTVYPMSGMGDVTYREDKEFKKFKQFVEAIDDPGANDMGLAGSMSGASNKEPLVTPADKYALSGVTIKKKKNVKI
jgi:predicted kinase